MNAEKSRASGLKSEAQSLTTGKKPRRNLAVLVLGVWIGVLVGIVALFALAWTGVISIGFDPKALLSGEEAPVVGELDQPAGDFTLPNLAGESVSLAGLRGKVVVVNFWATWCGPCIREMPMFDAYNQKYANSLVVLGIDLQETQNTVKNFIGKLQISYPILLDEEGEVARQYRVMALPNTLFIDGEGILRFHHIGVMSEKQFDSYLQQLGVGE